MRALPVFLGAFIVVAPAFAASSVKEEPLSRVDVQPRSSPVHEEDRWEGRPHILHDELWHDSTDGHAANPKAECRNFTMQYKRADGTTAIRRENRCN